MHPDASAAGGRGEEDWAAVAEALNARLAVCRMSQHRLAEVAGISVATIRRLQRGAGGRRARDDTLAVLSGAPGWPGDHLIRVLLGEQPPDATGTRPRVVGARKRRPRQVGDRGEGGFVEGNVGSAGAGPRLAGCDDDRPALACVAEDLGVVVELLAGVLDQLADLAAAGVDTDLR
ncbi:hypothetical protein [Pseudofrankia sp. BMG5.37]|nr:hypothetical protein [Pseudofrankia sp. BMG5.37]MDT3443603.1 XRE family transcriptional regulator [Pseudofrankia sp. BMG5.37]OHV43940.1 hypothetical protein BCD48_26440 [Pseudofrankia sp. BMG5.36]